MCEARNKGDANHMKLLVIGALTLVPLVASAQDARTKQDARVVKARATGDQVACESLAASLKLPDAQVTAASVTAAGSFTPPAEGTATPRPIAGLPAFRRVPPTPTPPAAPERTPPAGRPAPR